MRTAGLSTVLLTDAWGKSAWWSPVGGGRRPGARRFAPRRALGKTPVGTTLCKRLPARLASGLDAVGRKVRERRRNREAEEAHRAARHRLPLPGCGDQRSEEDTSELQSPYDLVCRLMLE